MMMKKLYRKIPTHAQRNYSRPKGDLDDSTSKDLFPSLALHRRVIWFEQLEPNQYRNTAYVPIYNKNVLDIEFEMALCCSEEEERSSHFFALRYEAICMQVEMCVFVYEVVLY